MYASHMECKLLNAIISKKGAKTTIPDIIETENLYIHTHIRPTEAIALTYEYTRSNSTTCES